jgi:hypothetical protein
MSKQRSLEERSLFDHHRLGLVAERLELVDRVVAGRSGKDGRNALDDRGAGVLDSSRLVHMEDGVRLAGDLPVAEVAVIRAVDLADLGRHDIDALIGLGRDARVHAKDLALGNDAAHRVGVGVLLCDIGDILLDDLGNRKAKLLGERLVGVPDIGRDDLCRMCERLLELLRGESYAVRLCECHAVLIDIVGDRTLDLVDAVHSTGEKADDAYPEDILHAGTDHRGARGLCDGVEAVRGGRGRGPGEGCLLAGRDDGDAAGQALLCHRLDIVDKAEEREDCDIRSAGVEHCVCVIGDLDAELHRQPCEVSGIHADDLGVRVDGADKLCTMLMQIADGVLCHLSTTVLDDPHWPATHGKPPRTCHRLEQLLDAFCACLGYTAFYLRRYGPVFTKW